MANSSTKILPYTSVLIKLLKGPVEYLEKTNWEKLLQYKGELTTFVQQLGLSLVLDEEDGYAYLVHTVSEDEESEVSWINRRAFTYDESVLLVLLRDMLAEFEVGEVVTRELIRKRREIKEYAALFFKENPSRVKFLKDLDRLIDRAEENGFLAMVENSDFPDEQKFRIRKIIKAKVDAEVLEQFTQQLAKHATERIQHG
jgi:hypothetical protein